MAFCSYLEKKLLGMKMSQRELAKEVGVTNATVNRWVKPYSDNPHEESMKKVIAFFGEDASEIIRLFRLEEEVGKYFWKNLRSLMEEKDIALEQISKSTGISIERLRRYYAGEVNHVDMEDIDKIADALVYKAERLLSMPDNYHEVCVIGGDEGKKVSLGSCMRFKADFVVGTREM